MTNLLPFLQPGFKENGVVNISEAVMFELKGDADTKEAQQSTKGVGNLLNMDTFSTLRGLRNKLATYVPSSPTCLDSARAAGCAVPCVRQSTCPECATSPERKLSRRCTRLFSGLDVCATGHVLSHQDPFQRQRRRMLHEAGAVALARV